MLENEFQQLVDYISDWAKAMNESSKELEQEMETLDEESKDYQLLDFEYNWTQGQVTAAEHFLSVADDMIRKINEE